jgi:hypothetical protein
MEDINEESPLDHDAVDRIFDHQEKVLLYSVFVEIEESQRRLTLALDAIESTSLSERQRDVFLLRKMKIRDVGGIYNITNSRIQQIYERAKRVLQNRIDRNFFSAIDLENAIKIKISEHQERLVNLNTIEREKRKLEQKIFDDDQAARKKKIRTDLTKQLDEALEKLSTFTQWTIEERERVTEALNVISLWEDGKNENTIKTLCQLGIIELNKRISREFESLKRRVDDIRLHIRNNH